MVQVICKFYTTTSFERQSCTRTASDLLVSSKRQLKAFRKHTCQALSFKTVATSALSRLPFPPLLVSQSLHHLFGWTVSDAILSRLQDPLQLGDPTLGLVGDKLSTIHSPRQRRSILQLHNRKSLKFTMILAALLTDITDVVRMTCASRRKCKPLIGPRG
jgi:hypothetical protein